MATIRFNLDTRSKKCSNGYPLKLVINHKSRAATLPLIVRISESQWDEAKERVVKHQDQSTINAYLTSVKHAASSTILNLANQGLLKSYSAIEIKDEVDMVLNPEKKTEEENKKLFAYRFRQFAERKTPRMSVLWVRG